MKLRTQILLVLLLFGLIPLFLAVVINLPLVLERAAQFYQKAYLQNLRADFRDLDQHLASRHEMIRLLAKLPEPGLILGEQGDDEQIDFARARYTEWINQVLSDQRDIIQLVFIDSLGDARFWLERSPRTLRWYPTATMPKRPSEQFVETGWQLQPGGVLVSRIRIDSAAANQDPRWLMTLKLLSTVGGEDREAPMGLVVMTIDVGGLAQFYRDTLWVSNNGSYLRSGKPLSDEPEAFENFPGLERIFETGTLGLWHGEDGEQLLWVPMFLTEDGGPLWVARRVDPSPIERFRDALGLRVLSIVFLLIVVVMFMARWIAARTERFGRELSEGLGEVLRNGRGVRFNWNGPHEVRELGRQLTTLAEAHAQHLREARLHTQELEKSNRFKSDFLANVSHELRTPLNSIWLLSKMLADGHSGLNPAQRRQAMVIHEACRDLRTMIDNILDISRIDAGQVTVGLEWVDLRSLLGELVELVGPQFASKGLYLELDIRDDVPEQIYTDRDKVRQILKNFLANAVKFTERGGATLIARCREGSFCPLELSVVDTGIGIPEDKQHIIFEAFQQADGSTRRRYGGTGLGLSISRELAKLLGGRILLESTEGKGSAFTLQVPIELDPSHLDAKQVVHEADAESEPPAEVPLIEPSEDQPFGNHWVLLVEREVQGLLATTSLIESLGLGVQTAADTDEALETLQEDDSCALILVADRAPGATEGTLQAIRAAPCCRNTPIWVVLEDDDPDYRARLRAAGADGFLPDPVIKAELKGAMASLLNRDAESTPERLSALP